MSRSEDRRRAVQGASTLRAIIDRIARVEVAIAALNAAALAEHQSVIAPDVRRAIIDERDRLTATLGAWYARAEAPTERDS